MDIREYLLSIRDDKHRDFLANLIPTIDKSKILGIKNPVLRDYAKELFKEDNNRALEFISTLEHEYFEETLLHLFIIENIRNFDLCIEKTNQILPYIDNWALSDTFNPKVFRKNLSALKEHINIWIESEHLYTKRFAMLNLLRHYLKSKDYFSEQQIQLVADKNDDRYYVKMMVAWYFSMALVHRYKITIPFFHHQYLDSWTHNKAIQKAIESRQVTKDMKIYLRTLKVK